MTLETLRMVINGISGILNHGCSDGGCVINTNRKGMKTNGGCRCTPRDIGRDLADLGNRVTSMGRNWTHEEEA
jgi:hypothetical protein